MIEKKEWKEFMGTGLLWWINMILHTFGWAICIEMDNDKIINVYPARVKFRGFSERINSDGYKMVSNFIKNTSEDLCNEACE